MQATHFTNNMQKVMPPVAVNLNNREIKKIIFDYKTFTIPPHFKMLQKFKTSYFFSFKLSLIGLFFSLFLLVFSGFAQDAPNPARGLQTGASYSVSDIETVNMTNGNLMINIPLASLAKGRGSVGNSISLMYNSKLYDNKVQELLNSRGQMTSQNTIAESGSGGWKYATNNYFLEAVGRFDDLTGFDCNDGNAGMVKFSIKVQMNMPDGSKKEFRPTNFTDNYNDGYYDVMPSGYKTHTCNSGPTLLTSSGMTYYSVDGSYTKLVVDYNGNVGRGEANPWTMYLADGSKVRHESSGFVRVIDRNGNYIQGLTDNFGRSISLQYNAAPDEDHIKMQGVGGEELLWKVKWKEVLVSIQYQTTSANGKAFPGGTSNQTFNLWQRVVDRITLPVQLGNLFYEFHYNAENNIGFGELSSITMPSGATASYGYKGDAGLFLTTDFILKNSISGKTLTYLEEYDGSSNSRTDNWIYSIGNSFGTGFPLKKYSSLTAPDGRVSTNYFVAPESGHEKNSLVYLTMDGQGNRIDKIWALSRPPGSNSTYQINPYVKTEFTTIPDANGNPLLTKITDYTTDPNGNITETREYD